MKEIIEEVIVNIDSKMTDKIYEESLEIIRREYDCKRLRSLHEFLINISIYKKCKQSKKKRNNIYIFNANNLWLYGIFNTDRI